MALHAPRRAQGTCLAPRLSHWKDPASPPMSETIMRATNSSGETVPKRQWQKINALIPSLKHDDKKRKCYTKLQTQAQAHHRR